MATKPIFEFVNDDWYTPEQEEWDLAACIKAAKYTAKDGYGTPYPFKGYIGCSQIGSEYNHNPLPKIHPDFQIEMVLSWGYRIIKKDSPDKHYRGKIQ